MLNIPIAELRRRMEEGIDTIIELFKGETVTRRTDWFELNIPYMYFSAWHWTKMVNGYSGFLPQSYRDFSASIEGFPNGGSVDGLLRHGVTHMSLHCALWSPEECQTLIQKLDADRRFTLVVSTVWQGAPSRLYSITR